MNRTGIFGGPKLDEKAATRTRYRFKKKTIDPVKMCRIGIQYSTILFP